MQRIAVSNGQAVRALLVAAAVGSACVWLTIAIPAFYSLRTAEAGFATFMAMPIVFTYLLMLLVAVVASLAIGYPLYSLVLRPLGISWGTSIAFGLVCGAALMAWWPMTPDTHRDSATLIGAAAGAAGGIAFYLSARASNNSLERSRER